MEPERNEACYCAVDDGDPGFHVGGVADVFDGFLLAGAPFVGVKLLIELLPEHLPKRREDGFPRAKRKSDNRMPVSRVQGFNFNAHGDSYSVSLGRWRWFVFARYAAYTARMRIGHGGLVLALEGDST